MNNVKFTKKQLKTFHSNLSKISQNVYSIKKYSKKYSKKNKLNKKYTKSKNLQNYKNIYETKVFGDHNKYIDGIDIIYWINLDRSIDRRKTMELVLSNFDIKNVRIKASDGKLESDSAIYDSFICNKFVNTKLEYACLLSHLNTIKEFANSNNNIALIMEDDVSLEFSIYWDKSLSTIINNAPKDWEIIMVGFMPTPLVDTFAQNLYQDNTHNKNKNNILYSTFSYIINKKGAQKFMNKLIENNKYNLNLYSGHEADVFIYKLIQTYTYKYPYFTFPLLNDTNIQTNIIFYNYQKSISLMNWKKYIYDNTLINNNKKYFLNINKNINKNNILKYIIRSNSYGYYAYYYNKQNNKVITYYVIKLNNNNKNNKYIFYKDIYFINLKGKNKPFIEKILSNQELIQELNKIKELQIVLNHIKKL